ncbi:Small-conductance mechanosensitive channel [Granulicella pectinivorans]|uniref:Small-conductance mechanosensitive channel n=2 Tax=Granulicella pectinivorans TaxID=474950 RepID=A0A1I6L124_9BACT|nr:Small-conductance mechanosensitive channel [Granulicella pectinivorans]
MRVMSGVRKILISVLVGGLLVCMVAGYMTRGALATLPSLRSGNVKEGVVDQSPWQTAQTLASLAVSREEKTFAQEAERLADHEVDQAFAQALRQASTEATNLTGEALAISKKVADDQQTVKEDQAEVDRLAAAVKGPKGADLQDELDVSKSELALDKSQLDDEQEHLARASGDKRSQIQRELSAREAAMKKFDDQLAGGGEVAVISTQRYGTLWGRASAWFSQRSRKVLLDQAAKQSSDDAAAIGKKIEAMKASMGGKAPDAGQPTVAAGQTIEEKKARVARLQKREAADNITDIAQDRMQTEQQLAGVYSKWSKQVGVQHEIVNHLLLNSFALVIFVVLATMVAGAVVRALLARAKLEPRQARTLRTILDLGIQLVGILLIALVVFGPPSQVPTILGLATAGLTVVFQDFILAFFGWFVLMGSKGIRVGDWVEIDSVAGEVVEIGLFRTALLETGNWTDKGHPTGRRVTFINSFAIRGQYFNFSTAGQWMWDEISMNIPPSDHSYQLIEEIHALVLKETEEDTLLAEAEWRGASKSSGLSQFSATPSVDLRPAASGVDIKVRYVTRAGDRFSMRNKLYQDTIAVLQKSGVEAK